MFRKIIATVILSLSALSAYAAQTTIDISGLSEAQVAELKAVAAKKVAEAAKGVGDVTPEKVTAGVTLAATWGTQAAAAAEGFARAMGIAAKELNITINDFLKTPAGVLTAGLIIWKMAGAALMHAMFGFIILLAGLIMVRTLYVRLFTKGYEKVEYKRFWGAWSGTRMVRVHKNINELENDGEWLVLWLMIIVGVATLMITGSLL